jgi:ubiquinone/menaquinone biosynthesis C-methylase UbiE
MQPVNKKALARKAVTLNRLHWNEISKTHLTSVYYPIDRVVEGSSSISQIETKEIGDLRSLKGAHLQCGIGLDTITLSRLGANMFGFDISREALRIAAGLANTAGCQIAFKKTSLTSIPKCFNQYFDFAYTSHGVLRWLPDLKSWAKTIFRILKPGGFFYLFEIHPLVYRLNSVTTATISMRGDYFHERVNFKVLKQTHASTTLTTKGKKVAHTDWTLASIVNSILATGLSIEFLNEHKACSYSRKGLLRNFDDCLWHPATPGFPIPLSFSIRATKPR